MKVPFYTATREYNNRKAEFDAAISKVLEKGDFILGNAVKEFETQIAEYSQAKHAIGVANGSDALVIASDILGYNNNQEVLTPTFTFFASTSCIARLGGTPVFTDVDYDTFCMDMNDAASRITKNTKGILPVHLFLQMADMNACMQLAKDNNLSVLEDAAEAFGMKQNVQGKILTAGTVGDFGVYSFFPTKTLGGYGDGGIITTNSDDYAAQSRALRVHGSQVKYHHDYVGYNSRLDTLQAAILSVKLQKIDEGIAKRTVLGNLYNERLASIEQIKLPIIKSENVPVFYVYNLKVQDRDALNAYLQSKGIGTSIYYPMPLHLQKCFSHLGHKKGDFPVAEKLCTEVLALPMYPELTEDEAHYVCDAIEEFYNK